MTRNPRILSMLLLAGWSLIAAAPTITSQSPQPIVVQAASATASTPVPLAASKGASSESIADAIKSLEELKAATEEILKKQQATLEQLDDVQKNAEQLRIFASRG
jgi:hypothetical protein